METAGLSASGATRANNIGVSQYGKPRKWQGRANSANNSIDAVYTTNNLIDPHPKARNKDGICDRGSTLHCLCVDSPSLNEQTDHSIIRATQPDGMHITSSVQCDFKNPNIPPGTSKAYKFRRLAGNSLISLPSLLTKDAPSPWTKTKLWPPKMAPQSCPDIGRNQRGCGESH